MRAHLGADAGALQAVDDHAVFRLQPLADHAQAFVERPEHHRLRLDRVVVLDHEHDLARLVGGDRRIRQQQRLVRRAADQPDAAELAGQDREILVRDHRAAAQRAGRDIEAVVEEIHLAVMRGLGLAGQRHLHRVRRIARARALAFEPEPAVLHDRSPRRRRNRCRSDRARRSRSAASRRPRCPARDCRADEMAADAAGDRRHHMAELDVELGRLQRAFGLHLGGVRRLQGLAALVDDLHSETALVWTRVRRAVEFALGKLRLGAGVRQAGRWPARPPPRTGGRRSRRADRPALTIAPSRNSTMVTKPPTRARTWTSSTASKRPVNSSQSVTVRLTGCATVTGGAGGAAAVAAACRRSRQRQREQRGRMRPS